jgi:hypothetical protein
MDNNEQIKQQIFFAIRGLVGAEQSLESLEDLIDDNLITADHSLSTTNLLCMQCIKETKEMLQRELDNLKQEN